MRQKSIHNLILFLFVFVVSILNSQTIGNSFALHGTPSSIIRLTISKSIKPNKQDKITDSQQEKKKQMDLAISENRKIGGSQQNDNSCVYQNKINRLFQTIDLYNRTKNTLILVCKATNNRQILRI